MKDQRPLFEKSLAKTFRLWILLLEKHMFSTRNKKAIKVLGKVWKTLFQKGFPVMMQQKDCHSNGLTHFKCSSRDMDEYILTRSQKIRFPSFRPRPESRSIWKYKDAGSSPAWPQRHFWLFARPSRLWPEWLAKIIDFLLIHPFFKQ